jgi:GTPase SAR1 family protein
MPVFSQPRRVTFGVLGQTGAGKSQLLNAWLKNLEAFKASASADSVTALTSSSENEIDGILRTGIDTQGLDDTHGVDEAHIQQMVLFLNKWAPGVNAFALVINGQADRFDLGTQRLVKLVNTFFGDPSFWDHVCIVFTKCFAGCDDIDRATKEREYRGKVLELISKCPGQAGRQPPQLPVFFVDSKKFDTDPETRSQMALLHGFVCGLSALPTPGLKAPNPKYLRVDKEIRNKVLVNTRTSGDTQILTFADQEREKQFGYFDEQPTFSEWKSTRTWDEYRTRSSRTEKRTRCESTNSEQLYHFERGRHIGLWGPREQIRVNDGIRVTRNMVDEERTIESDFDGRTRYGEWRSVRHWTD